MIERSAYRVPHRHDLKAQKEKAQKENTQRQHEIRFLMLSRSQTLVVRVWPQRAHCIYITVIVQQH